LSAKRVVGKLGLALLAVMILLSPDRLIFDERFHVPTIDLLREKGLTSEYLRYPTRSAPGPLYAVVIPPIDIKKSLAVAADKVGLPKLTRHMMRHTSIQTTLNVYGHLYPDDQQAVAAIAEKVFKFE
jgi:hypothetical protein